MYRQLEHQAPVVVVQKPETKPIEKHPYVALQRMNDKMTESQKEGVRVWNSMVNKLREAGLMEEKK